MSMGLESGVDRQALAKLINGLGCPGKLVQEISPSSPQKLENFQGL
jgi:hypothetical protein